MPRAAIVGNLVLDVVAGAPERPGGMVWYCARALREIDPDADVVLVCRSAAEDRDSLVPPEERTGESETPSTRFVQSVVFVLTNGEWRVFHSHRSFPPAK